jgi:hypothetical protein
MYEGSHQSAIQISIRMIHRGYGGRAGVEVWSSCRWNARHRGSGQFSLRDTLHRKICSCTVGIARLTSQRRYLPGLHPQMCRESVKKDGFTRIVISRNSCQESAHVVQSYYVDEYSIYPHGRPVVHASAVIFWSSVIELIRVAQGNAGLEPRSITFNLYTG